MLTLTNPQTMTDTMDQRLGKGAEIVREACQGGII